MKYNHKSETLVGIYLRLAVARQMRIRYQHQCVPAVWSCEDVLCIEGLSLSTQTYTHRVFPPLGLWCQCAFTLWEGESWCSLPAATQNVIPMRKRFEQRLKSNTRENSAAQNCTMVDILWSFTELVLLSV